MSTKSTKSSTKTNKENKRRSKEEGGDLCSVLDKIFSEKGSILEKMDLAFGSCSSDSSSSPSSNYSNNINYYN
jgi:hypothetical protein